MSTTKKIVIGVGVATGALLAAWLLTGKRKKATTDFIKSKVKAFKTSTKDDKDSFDDTETHYV